MKKWMAWMLAAMMLLACGSAAAVDFVQGIDPEYKPFTYVDDDGNYVGFDIDVAKAVCDLLGMEHKVFPVEWPNKLVQLSSHECDCVWSGMTIVDTMADAGYNLSEPYFYNEQVLVVKPDSGIASSADLAGKVVAVMLGTSGESLLNEDLADLKDTFASLTTCESFPKAFVELEGGAADAVLVDLPVALNYVGDRTDLVILNESLGAEQYGIAFRPEDAELCAKVNEAIRTLVENGTYAEIAAKYPSIDPINLLFLKK